MTYDSRPAPPAKLDHLGRTRFERLRDQIEDMWCEVRARLFDGNFMDGFYHGTHSVVDDLERLMADTEGATVSKADLRAMLIPHHRELQDRWPDPR